MEKYTSDKNKGIKGPILGQPEGAVQGWGFLCIYY